MLCEQRKNNENNKNSGWRKLEDKMLRRVNIKLTKHCMEKTGRLRNKNSTDKTDKTADGETGTL